MTKNLSDINKVSKITHVPIAAEDVPEGHIDVHARETLQSTEDDLEALWSASHDDVLPHEISPQDNAPSLPIPADLSSIPLKEFLTDPESSTIENNDTVETSTVPISNSPIPSDPPPSLPQEIPLSVAPKCDGHTKTIFMGTGDFAGYILSEILAHHACDIVAVVTQPDKKLGRKKSGISRSLAPNPVRDITLAHKLPLLQPTKFDAEAIAAIERIAPDLFIVASYGKILPKSVLDIPKIAAINIHTSLLPKLRGSSPIQNALLLGLKETGVTIMMMDEGMDTGDIIAQISTPIDAHEKTSELTQKLSRIGAQLFIETYPKIINKTATTTPQDHSQATVCQMIDREDGHIQWTDSTEEIYDRYRALYPWPGIFGYWEITENQMMRIKLRGIYPYTGELTDDQKELMPGTVFIARDQLCIKTFDTAIILEAIQPECKAVMPVYDFLNGYKEFEGAVLR